MRVPLDKFVGGLIAYNQHWNNIYKHKKNARLVAKVAHTYRNVSVELGEVVTIFEVPTDVRDMILKKADGTLYSWPWTHLHFYELPQGKSNI